MKLRTKIYLTTAVFLLITVSLITAFNIYNIRQKGEEDLKLLRAEEIKKARQGLKDVVDIAYGILEVEHQGLSPEAVGMDNALHLLSKIRFDSGEGYFWITDNQLPYPTMVMHAAKPQNAGKVMSDVKYNVVKDKEGKNLYQERVEKCLADGEAYVDYIMNKPGDDKVYNKLSYSKHFKPLGWIISSGIYTDSIDEVITAKTQELNEQINQMIFQVLIISAILLIISLATANYFGKILMKLFYQVRDRLTELSRGNAVAKINTNRSDEIGDMMRSLDELVSGLANYTDFASEIGKGNLTANFEKLSDRDVLGAALLSMRDNLAKVINETNEVVRAAGDDGILETRMEVSSKEGAWQELGTAINSLLSSVASPLMSINQIVNALAQGDLTKRYEAPCKGDIRSLVDDLNQATTNLDELLSQISKTATVVDDSSSEMLIASEEMNTNTGEISSAISEMSSGAQSQVIKVDESSTLIEGVLNSSNNMREMAETINSAAQSGVDNSQKGKDIVQNVGESMEEISNYSLRANESIQVLTSRSEEITRVLGVITDIASQTNLLALNAAIEAAQAGESGRGFAVVAEEIRKLAEDSRASAKAIEQLINDVRVDTEKAAEIITEMKESVKNGGTASEEASEVFKEISDSTRQTLTISEDIVKATQAQGEDIKNVVSLTESVVVIAEQTAAGTEEVASSAQELSSGMSNYTEKSKQLTTIATELKLSVSQFKVSDSENKKAASEELDPAILVTSDN